MNRALILLFLSIGFSVSGGLLEASSDFEKEMAYINSITSTNTPTLSFESTLPTVDTPVIVVQEAQEVVVMRQEAE